MYLRNALGGRILFGIKSKESRRNKKRIRLIFDRLVEQGDQYTLICCKIKRASNAVLVNPPRYAHLIVGYKEKVNRTLVIIPVSVNLKEMQEPIVFTKRNGSDINFSKFGYCNAQDDYCSLSLEAIVYTPISNRGKLNSFAIMQSKAEAQALHLFFKNGL